MSPSRWDDLRPRLLSAAVMIVVGLGAIWLGGIWFQTLVAVVVGLMVWELLGMVAPESPHLGNLLGGVAAALMLIAPVVPIWIFVAAIAALTVYGTLQITSHKAFFAVAVPVILLAGLGLVALRAGPGMMWLVWLVLVVVATDVAGYFAGRLMGGPKFWPSISPKKTWSGTGAGWVAAGIVGLIFGAFTAGAGAFGLAMFSVAVSFASQMGDIAESAIKRRCGVKDSSTLIPGHGGLLDRFDGLLGAAVFVMIASLLIGFPPGG